ncbi:MAG: cytidine/deoxycytidylate deaminase family protein [Candidatus Margulisbacteria bacterium]|nr:cytidine/deoxycytidylate deaminase family protein [Candidatus Margulisiibacteriota bacterium]
MVTAKKRILKRPAWDTYFMNIADVVATRATCIKRQVGAVIVKNEQILATGYNGAPRGMRHAAEVGCLREQLEIPSGTHHELCRGLHAEQNAIIQAARNGANIDGGTLYSTYMPCVICAKMIINAGIKRIVFKGYYPDELAVQMLTESKIDIHLFEEKYTEEEIKITELSADEKAVYKL